MTSWLFPNNQRKSGSRAGSSAWRSLVLGGVGSTHRRRCCWPGAGGAGAPRRAPEVGSGAPRSCTPQVQRLGEELGDWQGREGSPGRRFDPQPRTVRAQKPLPGKQTPPCQTKNTQGARAQALCFGGYRHRVGVRLGRTGPGLCTRQVQGIPKKARSG